MTKVKSILSVASVLAVLMSAPVVKAAELGTTKVEVPSTLVKAQEELFDAKMLVTNLEGKGTSVDPEKAEAVKKKLVEFREQYNQKKDAFEKKWGPEVNTIPKSRAYNPDAYKSPVLPEPKYASAAAKELADLKREKDAFAVRAIAPTPEMEKANQAKADAMQDKYDQKYLEAIEQEIADLSKKEDDLAKDVESKWQGNDKRIEEAASNGRKDLEQKVKDGKLDSKALEAEYEKLYDQLLSTMDFMKTEEGKKLRADALKLGELKEKKISFLKEQRQGREERRKQRDMQRQAESAKSSDSAVPPAPAAKPEADLSAVKAEKEKARDAIQKQIDTLTIQVKAHEDMRKSMVSSVSNKVPGTKEYSDMLGGVIDSLKKQIDSLKAGQEESMK